MNILEKDSNHVYALNKDANYGSFKTKRWIKAFHYEDDVLFLLSIPNINESTVIIKIKAFDKVKSKQLGLWDGTSLLPDKGTKSLDALFLASLPHDVIYALVEKIADQAELPESDILAFADDILEICAIKYGCKESIAKKVHWLTRLGGGAYHKIKKVIDKISLFFILILSTTFLTTFGCFSNETYVDDGWNTPEINWSGPYLIDSIDPIDPIDQNVITNVTTESNSSNSSNPGNQSNSSNSSANTLAISLTSFGSPNVSKCSLDNTIRIDALKITESGLSFKWINKGNRWGCSEDEIGILAVLGYGSTSNNFSCAKFDWCRFSNTSRDFKNVKSGYNGWKWSDFWNAKYKCFYLMSKDGKKRTNILIK